MWNYYKTVVINSAKSEDGHDMFFEQVNPDGTTYVNIWRNGQYDLAKIGTVTKTEAECGSLAKMTIDCTKLIPEASEGVHDLGLYQLSFKVEMDGKFLSDYASPAYQGFYKPIVVGLDINDENTGKPADTAKYVAEQIKMALPENNEFIKVENKGNNVIITATDNYMFFKKESVKFEKYEVVGCDTCLGEYVPKKIDVKVVDGKQPFATGTWILENLRLPNTLNYRYFGSNDEMPVAGQLYNQYTFEYRSERPGLGGHSGVGQEIAAVTTHTFYVAQGDAAKKFEEVFMPKNENTEE